ncbi:MAG TPA: flagellar filament capping protein FliD [Verrucomicrobiae bacterium]
MDLSLSGLASGFDWKSLVDQLTDVERTPQKRLFSEQSLINQRNNAYSSIKTQLGVLTNRINALKDPALFDSRSASSTDATIASASVTSGAPAGQYAFAVTQLASSARQLGTTDAGASLSATNDVSGVVLGSAGFSTAITAGNITVNGKQVAITTTDTLQDVFNRIGTATGGVVTGSYDSATDKISLTSSNGNVVLGSATDTSNFLAVTRLNNNGANTVSSSAKLGGLKLTGALSSANFGTALSDGGSGAGQFKINGVAISFNATSDSLTNVLDRINSSTSGVNASYDAVNDRLVLTNKVTGDIGVAMEDVTGNFLAASGLSGGTLERGKNLTYKVDDGPELTSQTNTITQTSSGITGLSLSVLKEGTVKIAVSSDTSKIKTAITDFMAEYNRLQTVVDGQTASTTDAKGKVTAGILANDSTAYDVGASLRAETNRIVNSLTGSLKRLDDLGITSNGKDNALALTTSTALDEALANNLAGVKKLFTDSSDGIATRLSKWMDKTTGDTGTLTTKQNNLTKEAANLDTQMLDLERLVQANKNRLTASFVAMEVAQAKIKQQSQYLSQKFGSSTTSG